jgi:hypothetical protein
VEWCGPEPGLDPGDNPACVFCPPGLALTARGSQTPSSKKNRGLRPPSQEGGVWARRSGDHSPAPTQTDVAKRFKGTGVIGTYLFQEFAAGSDLGVFAIIHLALRNRPGSVVLVAPARSSRMYQQDLQLAAGLAIHQDAGTRGRSSTCFQVRCSELA